MDLNKQPQSRTDSNPLLVCSTDLSSLLNCHLKSEEMKMRIAPWLTQKST